jgi:hypothetical protein
MNTDPFTKSAFATLSCGYDHTAVSVIFHKTGTTAKYETYESGKDEVIRFKIYIDKDVAKENSFGDTIRVWVERENP